MKKIFLSLIFLACFFMPYQAKKSELSDQVLRNKARLIDSLNQQGKKNVKSSEKNRLRSKKVKKTTKLASLQESHQHEYLHWNEPAFWWNTFLAIFLSCAGGFFSGMTVGLSSLDKLHLQVQQIAGNQNEKKMAAKILNTIKDHHLYLVTLLIGNAMVLQWLPLVVHKIMPDWAAILTSTIAVVIVAEIVPMSYTTGPNKYDIAFVGSPMVDFCIKAFYFIAYPIARGLDALLGVHDSSRIQRRDFLAFVNDKRKNQLKPLEITFFNRLFTGPHLVAVKDVMTPLREMIFLEQDQEISNDFISTIQQSQIQILFVKSRQSVSKGKIDLSNPVKINKFVLNYLKKKSTIKSNRKLKPFEVICSLSEDDNKYQQINLVQKAESAVIYSDTSLLDAYLLLNSKKVSFAFVHRDQRRKQNTDSVFLDTNDFQGIDAPFTINGYEQIIGVIFMKDLYQAIADFKGDITSVIQSLKQDFQTPQPKKRKLVKRASIVSVHSLNSRDD